MLAGGPGLVGSSGRKPPSPRRPPRRPTDPLLTPLPSEGRVGAQRRGGDAQRPHRERQSEDRQGGGQEERDAGDMDRRGIDWQGSTGQ